MSPTPVTFASPTAPASYSWEATDEAVAARYGLDPATIVRFDLNTSPTPPDLIGDLLAAGRFEAPLSEYPPTDYRRLVDSKLHTASELYRFMMDQFHQGRAFVLELTIVVILIIDLVFLFRGPK